MDSASYLEYILHKLSATHDITRNYILEGQSDGEQEGPFPAYASYSSTSEKYVLTRKANLWTAKEYEHILFWAGADSRNETKNGAPKSSESRASEERACLGEEKENCLREDEKTCRRNEEELFTRAKKLIEESMEPVFVRKGEKYPQRDRRRRYVYHQLGAKIYG